MKKLSWTTVEDAFWVVYLLVPLFTGLFEYRYLPNEWPSEDKHEVLESHSEEVGTDGNTGVEVPDKWRDTRTGKAYTREMFRKHQIREAKRLGAASLAYGLIGCALFGFTRAKTGKSSFFEAFGRAMVANIAVAGPVYLII